MLDNNKVNHPLVRDLVCKAGEDVMKTVKRTLDIIPEDDPELGMIIINSITASLATTFAGQFIEGVFVFSSGNKATNEGCDVLNADQYKDLVAKGLSQIGHTLIKAHIEHRRQRQLQAN